MNCMARFTLIAILFVFAGCSKPSADLLQGYVEGEFVYLSSPLPGAVTLQVERGSLVTAGAPLFAIENITEKTARDEAGRRLAQARAMLDDAGKGLRPSELTALKARLQQSREALSLAERELARQERLFGTGAVSAQQLDRVRSARDQERQSVASFEAELQTAGLGARADRINADKANVRALEEALARAEWNLAQKSQRAPEAALVHDTLYRSGEWVPAGRPVVTLLPPRNIKVRAFLPEKQIGAIHPGDPVTVRVDGLNDSFSGKVSYISPRAEYTPPVIYSRESRAKMVFMVEATFAPEVAARLHPGQPVDLRFGR